MDVSGALSRSERPDDLRPPAAALGLRAVALVDGAEALLDEALRLSGAETPEAALRQALQEFVERARFQRWLDDVSAPAEPGP